MSGFAVFPALLLHPCYCAFPVQVGSGFLGLRAIRTVPTEEIVLLLAAFKPKSPDKMEEVWDLSEKTAKSICSNEILFTQLVGKC